jgi:DNA-directed RNA polymerase subunit RPC12/RpoP
VPNTAPRRSFFDTPEGQTEFIELSKFVMKTGKFAGKPLCQVSVGHLRWLSKQHIAVSTRHPIVRYLKLLQECAWSTQFICVTCGFTKQDSHPTYHCQECGSREIAIVRQPLMLHSQERKDETPF